MAIEKRNAQWIDVYANSKKSHSGTPMGIGGSARRHVFIRIPDSVKTLLRSSSTTTSLDMQVNFTRSGSEVDIGSHRESSSRPNGSNGIPWYSYNETWHHGSGTGTKTYEMSNWFKPNFLSGNTQGIVLYSYQGKYYNEINSVTFRVHGTWNRPPTTPLNARVDKTRPDISQVFRWNASSDPDGDTVRYDVEFYNGSSWSRKRSNTTSRTWTHNTTNERAVTNARYRVRATDGKETSSWGYSPTFEIRHVPPTIAESRLTYLDSNTTTRAITGNNQHIIQNASTVKASVASGATANDGKTIKRYIFTLSGQERIRSSVGSVTFNPINAENNQTLRVTVEDSAGLRTSVTKTVTVIPYDPPEIQYEANRVGSIENDTVLKVSGSISSLDGKNSLQLTQYRYRQTGSTNWSSTFTINRSVSGTNFTGSNVTIDLDSGHEWEIQVIVSDKVLTRRVHLTVSRGKPVMFLDEEHDRLGIGKFPTQGALDAEGEAYFTGDLYVNNVNQSRLQSFNQVINELGLEVSDTRSFWQTLPQGRYFVTPNSIPNQPTGYGIMDHVTQSFGSGSDFNVLWYAQLQDTMYRKWGNGNNNKSWKSLDGIENGSNTNGGWVEHRSGLIMCWHRSPGNHTGTTYSWDFPKKFNGNPIVNVSIRQTTSSSAYNGVNHGVSASSSSANIRKWGTGGMNYPFYIFAIGY